MRHDEAEANKRGKMRVEGGRGSPEKKREEIEVKRTGRAQKGIKVGQKAVLGRTRLEEVWKEDETTVGVIATK